MHQSFTKRILLSTLFLRPHGDACISNLAGRYSVKNRSLTSRANPTRVLYFAIKNAYPIEIEIRRMGNKNLPQKIQNETPSKTHVKTLPKHSIWSHLEHNPGGEYFTANFGP